MDAGSGKWAWVWIEIEPDVKHISVWKINNGSALPQLSEKIDCQKQKEGPTPFLWGARGGNILGILILLYRPVSVTIKWKFNYVRIRIELQNWFFFSSYYLHCFFEANFIVHYYIRKLYVNHFIFSEGFQISGCI